MVRKTDTEFVQNVIISRDIAKKMFKEGLGKPFLKIKK